MVNHQDHFGRGDDEYGRKPGIIVSVTIHVVLLVVGAWLSFATPDRVEKPMTATRVRLGGPKNLELGGPKSKAPVAGVLRSKPAPKKKDPPKKKTRRPPKTEKKVVGLNKEKDPPKKKKDPPKKATGTDNSSRKSSQKPAPAPEPKKDEKGPRALGGLGGDNGISVAVGDGAQDIDIEDVEFITYFKMVRAQLASRWTNRGLRGGATQVRFLIGRQGDVSDITILESSGYPHLDAPAKRAVMGSEFPPLPQSYKGDNLIVTMTFNYKK